MTKSHHICCFPCIQIGVSSGPQRLVTRAKEYSQVVHTLGVRAHVEVGRPLTRRVLARNVVTANEG